MSCHKPMLESLQRQGVRLTAQRALILEDLYHHRGHRTAEEIYRDVSARLPGLNLTTVYRTLDMLANAHVVSVFSDSDGLTEFELVRDKSDLHHHLHCRRCGAELPLDVEPVEKLRSEIAARYGFQADLTHLVITGLCAQCAAHQNE